MMKEHNTRNNLYLQSGDRVCIIGGGPAGSFAALYLLELAQKKDLKLEVLIFESRRFSAAGPGSCKGCAGILSSRLMNDLKALNIELPQEIIQSELHIYTAHIDGESVMIKQPNSNRRIVSVYRGSGPRLAPEGLSISFDRFLLDQACARGAQHIPAYVSRVRSGRRPVVCTHQREWEADLVVLASGINMKPSLGSEFGYLPPRIEIMAQDEIRRPLSWPENQVNVFFKQPPGLVFGAVVPKGDFLNISLLGNRMNRNAISYFIEAHGIELEPVESFEGLCGCMPRLAVGEARKYFGDRWVAVGDAAVSRLYKDGIGSACFTAQVAMQTAIEHGISEDNFRYHYKRALRSIVRDNEFGQLLLKLWAITINTPPLLKAWKKAVFREMDLPLEKRVFSRILWGVFTGDEFYLDLLRLALHPVALLRLLRQLI